MSEVRVNVLDGLFCFLERLFGLEADLVRMGFHVPLSLLRALEVTQDPLGIEVFIVLSVIKFNHCVNSYDLVCVFLFKFLFSNYKICF